jgi:hypothetical protein
MVIYDMYGESRECLDPLHLEVKLYTNSHYTSWFLVNTCDEARSFSLVESRNKDSLCALKAKIVQAFDEGLYCFDTRLHINSKEENRLANENNYIVNGQEHHYSRGW